MFSEHFHMAAAPLHFHFHCIAVVEARGSFKKIKLLDLPPLLRNLTCRTWLLRHRGAVLGCVTWPGQIPQASQPSLA